MSVMGDFDQHPEMVGLVEKHMKEIEELERALRVRALLPQPWQPLVRFTYFPSKNEAWVTLSRHRRPMQFGDYAPLSLREGLALMKEGDLLATEVTKRDGVSIHAVGTSKPSERLHWPAHKTFPWHLRVGYDNETDLVFYATCGPYRAQVKVQLGNWGHKLRKVTWSGLEGTGDQVVRTEPIHIDGAVYLQYSSGSDRTPSHVYLFPFDVEKVLSALDPLPPTEDT
jgi:hypothetical protein